MAAMRLAEDGRLRSRFATSALGTSLWNRAVQLPDLACQRRQCPLLIRLWQGYLAGGMIIRSGKYSN